MARFLSLVLGALLIGAVFILPNNPERISIAVFNRLPLELPVILLLAMVLGRMRGVIIALTLLVTSIALLKLADLATYTAYGRTFNPILDYFLIEAGLGLLRDSIGGPLAALVAVLAFVFIIGLVVTLRVTLKSWATLLECQERASGLVGSRLSPARPLAVAGLMISSIWMTADAGYHLGYWALEKSPAGTTTTTRYTVKRIAEIRETADDLVQFREAARVDTFEIFPTPLNRLGGRDVLLIWIESYGRASFDNPLYSATHGPTLRRAEAALANAGLAMKSGWLTSPTKGGESWLAHGALGSGLWTSNNGRYSAMIASGHKWLFHFAREGGYRTSAIMPAITVNWPESASMGFDLIYPAADIPYAGKPFNWVTMPDQFTLATYKALLPRDSRPDFTQIALISSHAPWTPVPEMVPWDKVGDGTIFNEMASRGPTPRVLWKNRDNVRDAYRRSIDYSLEAVFSYLPQLKDNPPLIIVSGDHQAVGFVSGSNNRDVPVHVIGPPDVLAMLDGWNWADGLFPSKDGPVRRMDSFRNDFLKTFSSRQQTAHQANRRDGP